MEKGKVGEGEEQETGFVCGGDWGVIPSSSVSTASLC